MTKCDLVIIVPLSEEFRVLNKICQVRHTEVHESIHYYEMNLANSNLRINAVVLGEMGNTHASQVTSDVLGYLRPQMAVLLGIAGSLNEDTKLGDVVVANEVNEFQASSKLAQNGQSSFLRFSGRHWQVNPQIANYVHAFEFTDKALYDKWRLGTKRKRSRIRLFDNNPSLANDLPRLAIGHVASGETILAAKRRQSIELIGIDRKFLAVETEGAGFMQAAQAKLVKAIVIRGISDFADDKKKQLDSVRNGVWRKYAMYSASTFLLNLLRANGFQKLVVGESLLLIRWAENLFYQLASAFNIQAQLEDEDIKNEICEILRDTEKYKQQSKIHRLKWALIATIASVRPDVIIEFGRMGEDEIKWNLAEANHLGFYRKFVASFAFQKMGFENHCQVAEQISEWQPNSLVRDEYAIRVLESYPEAEKCFVLTVTLARWLDARERLRKAILGSKETRILLMSPFAEDSTFSLFREEYEIPLRPPRYLSPYELNFFRKLCTCAEHLYALCGFENGRDNVQIRFYTNYKPPLKFTLYADKVAVVFPSPFKFSPDLYAFCGKVTTPSILDKIEEKYEEIWQGPVRRVHLQEKEIHEFIDRGIHSLARVLERHEEANQRNLTELKNWANRRGKLGLELYDKLVEYIGEA